LLEFKKYNAHNSSYRLSIDILSQVKLSADREQAEREEMFIKDICKRVSKKSTVLYLLRNREKTLGFIALSVSSIDSFPSLQIDYLFVSHPYRGVVLKELEESKTSIYLIEFAIEIATQIQDKVGLRSLVLLPDNERLSKNYQEIGFVKFPKKEWMFLKV